MIVVYNTVIHHHIVGVCETPRLNIKHRFSKTRSRKVGSRSGGMTDFRLKIINANVIEHYVLKEYKITVVERSKINWEMDVHM